MSTRLPAGLTAELSALLGGGWRCDDAAREAQASDDSRRHGLPDAVAFPHNREQVAAIVRAIRYAADKVGVQHVALGSDFNGTVHTPFDTTGLAQITEGLQGAGFSDADIAAIMGGNVRDLLLASLPD